MPYFRICVYVLLLIGTSLSFATSPLCVEFAVEKLYPVAEGVVGGWLNIWYSIIATSFLLMFDIPGIGTAWLNYVLPLSCVLVIPLIASIKEEHRRTGIDEQEEPTADEEEDNDMVDENCDISCA